MLQTPSLTLQARQGWSHVIPWGPVGHEGKSWEEIIDRARLDVQETRRNGISLSRWTNAKESGRGPEVPGSATFICSAQAQEPGRKGKGRQLGRLRAGNSVGPAPQMRLHAFWSRWGHWQVFFSLRSLLI